VFILPLFFLKFIYHIAFLSIFLLAASSSIAQVVFPKSQPKDSVPTVKPKQQENNLNVPIPKGTPQVIEEEEGMFAAWDNVEIDPYKSPVTADFVPVFIKFVDASRNEKFTFPHPGVITSHYGYRWHRMHKGTDIDCETGDIIKAAFNGVIRISRYHSGYGNLVIIRHDNGLETFYGHLSALLVSEGDYVVSGQEIGLGGNTGHSTGSHLHWEIRYRGTSIDSRKFVNYETRKLWWSEIYLDKSFFKIAPAPAAPPVDAVYYTVKRGDTIKSIAAAQGVSESKICALNRITKNTLIKVGRRLRIK
jgi:murein DD-endopeptidase MepM/ murein hydrolase activator NlpD